MLYADNQGESPMHRPLLILGTRNVKKAQELIELLEPLGLQVQTLAQVAGTADVDEDGDSFRANAQKKAVEQARRLKQWVLGEDSGLVVDALGGRPGIHSARYAGPGATDAANNARLLKELGDTPLDRRTGHYVSHVVLADPSGQIVAEATGQCHGRIRFAPSGTAGFGYDPLFELLEYHRTFGELGPHAKAALSHRARAVGQLIPHIKHLITSGQWTAAP